MCENKELDSQYLDLTTPSEQNSFSERINYLLERPNLSKSSSFRKSFLTLTKIEPDKENIFEFKLYNIVSMMYLFTEKNKGYTIYTFYWLPEGYTFDPVKYNPMSFNVLDNGVTKTCSLTNISTKFVILPSLKIGGKIYSGMDVPMIVFLTMAKYLGLNKCETVDASYVMVTYTNFDGVNKERRLQLVNKRAMMNKGSIYEKYGFKPYTEKGSIHLITLQQILDDYETRLLPNNIDDFHEEIKKESQSKFEYYFKMEEYQNARYLASELIGIIKEERDKNITIERWLEAGSSDIKSVLLLSLTNFLISWEIRNSNSQYYRDSLKFYKCYSDFGDNQLYNSNIEVGLEKFLSR